MKEIKKKEGDLKKKSPKNSTVKIIKKVSRDVFKNLPHEKSIESKKIYKRKVKGTKNVSIDGDFHTNFF